MAPQAPKYAYVVEDAIPMKEAASLLGMSVSVVCRLLQRTDPITGQPFLDYFRPMERNILIKTASVLRLREAIRTEPEFWARRREAAAASQKASRKPVAPTVQKR